MQNIQDKDFDQLFKDRFENAEIEPSAGLWSKINRELTPQNKRRLPVYWMAAAVVLIGVSAGLLLIKEEKIQLSAAEVVAHKQAPVIKKEIATAEVQITEQSEITKTSINSIQKPTKLVFNAANGNLVMLSNKKELLAMQPIDNNAHLTVIKPQVMPDLEQIVELPVSVETAVIAGVDQPAAAIDEVINENQEMERTEIKNVGDLVNFVVNKVDKREQKFLKFQTDEDDNSSLVGINIGFIKLNSKKHK